MVGCPRCRCPSWPEGAFARYRTGWSGCGVGASAVGSAGLHGAEMKGQPHVVAGERDPSWCAGVPVETEVAPVDRARHLDADAVVAPRVVDGAVDCRVELDLTCDALDGEVAHHSQRVVPRLYPRGLEGDPRMIFQVEELGGAQMLVALLGARVEARHLNGAARTHASRFAGRLDGPLEICEQAPHPHDAHVPDLELDR